MTFLDVSESAYGYSAIQFVTQANLMNGYPDGTFHPQATVTWAELCQIIAIFLENGDMPGPGAQINPRNWESHWAAPYIAYCVSFGIMNEDTARMTEFDQAVKWKDAHALLSRTKRKKNLLVIPESRRQGSTVEITRADLALLIYRTCELTGHSIAKSVFRLNKRNRWNQSLRLLLQYALCVPFVDSDISLIFKLISENPQRDPFQDALCYEHMAKILKRKGLFRNKETGPELFHYTSLNALEKLTQKNAKFRLSNVAYLNDPMEGHLFIRRMKECFSEPAFLPWRFLNRERDEFSINNSFVVSFTDETAEQLPMWVQYGEGGGGCRIGIRAKSIKAPIYSMVYDLNTVNQFLNSVKAVLNSYMEQAGEVDLNTDIVFSYAAKVMTQVSYLYKDKHYEHEREMRTLLFADPAAAKVEGKVRENEVFPRLYIELDDDVEISTITLGPRVSGIEKIAVALAGRNIDVSMLKKSEISYR